MEPLWGLKVLGSLVVAMLLGAAIGFERELAEKPAGMRTHMFVAGAAMLFVRLGGLLVKQLGDEFGAGLIRSDPIRLIEAIVTGVAFLGAGTIIRHRGPATIEGLTTAAALLFTAAMGIAVALGELLLAAGVSVLALVTLRVVRRLETRLKDRTDRRAADRGPT